MTATTGTSSKTIVILPDGFVTYESPPVCSRCAEKMLPLMWVCGCCGEVEP